MLRSWLSSGSVRTFCKAPRSLRPFLIPRKNFSSVSNLQTDRVPLRKQLKQEAKNLKAQKKQRKQNEEASRQEWELTVGVEIHAQLDTAAKLFSSMSTESLYWHR
jgi:aspartyl-tRNA(Asn)/glutamyl-tRNA(Gln) amidotransferase subunit B